MSREEAKAKVSVLDSVAVYYSAKVNEHGSTPRGVDWNGIESQRTRFAQITKVIDPSSPFSLLDVGCGYAALFDYLDENYDDFDYRGIDVSTAMIETARGRLAGRPASLAVGKEPASPADYCVASGIFSVKLNNSESEWRDYMFETMAMMDRHSLRGFAFNSLTSYSDADKMRPDLYYPDPLVIFDHCKRNYSRQVALLHDYGLWEFTILVRKG